MKTILKLQILWVLLIPFFVSAQQTSYDSDGDGIPDSIDQCMLVKGVAAYKGCPYEKRITANDRDGDGLKDVEDQCPDMFGLTENKGCPDIHEGLSKQKQALRSPNNSLFTTVSSLSKEEDETFREVLLRIVGDSSRAATMVTSEPFSAEKKTQTCLPGALQCYIKGDSKTFYADFGQYSDKTAAVNKYLTLKQKLSEALGENDWNSAETVTGSYIDKYQLTKREKNLHSPVVTTHVQKMNNTYGVYITVENK